LEYYPVNDRDNPYMLATFDLHLMSFIF
jgi:hypothetical protein